MSGGEELTGTPFEAIGSEEAVLRLVEDFYRYMDTLPECRVIREMHAEELAPMVDKLATFLVGWMGGPQRYTERFGRVVIPVAHKNFDIGDEESAQWLLCMERALADSEFSDAWQERLMVSFSRMAKMCQTR